MYCHSAWTPLNGDWRCTIIIGTVVFTTLNPQTWLLVQRTYHTLFSFVNGWTNETFLHAVIIFHHQKSLHTNAYINSSIHVYKPCVHVHTHAYSFLSLSPSVLLANLCTECQFRHTHTHTHTISLFLSHCAVPAKTI
jgi:hypothetical protein